MPDTVFLAEADFLFELAAGLGRDMGECGLVFKDLFWWFEGVKLQPDGEGGWGKVEEDRGRKLEKLIMGTVYEGEKRGKGDRRVVWNGWREDQRLGNWYLWNTTRR